MMRVVVYHNSIAIKTYEFTTELVTVGRLATNTIPINSMGISRHHLKLERDLDTGKMYASDMGSLNGSFVNNQRVEKMVIQDRTDVVMGKYSLHVEFTEMQVPIAPAPQAAEQPQMLTTTTSVDGSVTSEHQIIINMDEEAENNESTQIAEGNFVFTSSKNKASEIEAEELDSSSTSAVLIDLKRQVIYKINKTRMTFGSDKSADIFVESGVFSSDKLAMLTVEDNVFTITKGNGKLKINEKKSPSHILAHKDKVKVDNSEFSFMIKDN